MKSLLYIEESAKQKAELSKFIKNILRKEYDVYEFSYDSHNNDANNYKLLADKTFDVVVCWQVIPSRSILDEKVSYKRGILFPLHDEGHELSLILLDDYNDFLMINFSKSIYLQCLSNGIRTHYIPYFSKPEDGHDLDNQNLDSAWSQTSTGKINKWIDEFCDNKKNILIDEKFFLDEISTNNIKYIINHDMFHVYVLCKSENILFMHNAIQKNNFDVNIVTSHSEFDFIDVYLCSNLDNESLVNNKKWISKYNINDINDIKSILKNIEKMQMSYPKVTIVTVIHNIIKNNRREYLIRCFNSIHHQIYDGEIEHLVIDGGSDDGTLDLLKCYAEKGWIQFFSEPDDGIYDAMNKGLAKATGEFIVYINSDDWYGNIFALKCCTSSLIRDNSDYCFGNSFVILPDGTKSAFLWVGNIGKILYGQHYCHQSLFVKTNVMREMGGFNLKYKISADSDFMLRLYVLHKKYTYVNLYYVRYRLGGWSSMYADQSSMDYAQALYKLLGKKYNLTFEECYAMTGSRYVNWPLNTFISFFKKLSDERMSRVFALQYFDKNFDDKGFNINKNIEVRATQYFFYKKMLYKLLSFLPIKAREKYIKKYQKLKNDLKNAKTTKIYLTYLKIITRINFNNITFYNILTNIPLLSIKHDRNFSIYIFGIKILCIKNKKLSITYQEIL